MKIKSIEITTANNSVKFDLANESIINVIKGEDSEFYLNVIFAITGGYDESRKPIKDGELTTSVYAEIEVDGKEYNLNAIFNKREPDLIAVNFSKDGRDFSISDTEEYMIKMSQRNIGICNVFDNHSFVSDNTCFSDSKRLNKSFYEFLKLTKSYTKEGDDRPIFILNFFERLDETVSIAPSINELASLNRQIFISVNSNFSDEKIAHFQS